jgi:hypothetical protein
VKATEPIRERQSAVLGCIFAGVDVDHRDYSIKFVTNDGSELKFSLRGLFEQFFDKLKGR